MIAAALASWILVLMPRDHTLPSETQGGYKSEKAANAAGKKALNLPEKPKYGMHGFYSPYENYMVFYGDIGENYMGLHAPEEWCQPNIMCNLIPDRKSP